MDPAVVTSVGAVIVACVGAAVGLRNGTVANRPGESNAQLAWVKQAQDEATDARTDAREARADAAQARTETEALRRQAVRLRSEFDEMQAWVDRVVRARNAFLADHPLETLEDTGVIRIMKAINGGPQAEA